MCCFLPQGVTDHQYNTGVDNPSFHGNFSSRIMGNSWKGFTKLDASHPEHPYIHQKSSQVTRANHGKSHLNLYKNMCWVLAKFPPSSKKKTQKLLTNKKISKSTRKSLPLLSTVLVSGWCMGLKGHWWQSYKKGYHSMSERTLNSLRAENQCSVSGHWTNTDYWSAWHMTAHTVHCILCSLSGMLIRVEGEQ